MTKKISEDHDKRTFRPNYEAFSLARGLVSPANSANLWVFRPIFASQLGRSLVPVTKRNMKATLEERPSRLYDNQTELVQRLLAEFCELCGSEKDVEVHHVRAMRKLHEYPGRSKPEWVKRMIALRRKTLILCKRCHEAIEHGLPITWTLITLKEVKARRKARMITILESRMQ